MNKVIRIGTRDSQLALWQAHTVEKQLESLGYKTQLVPVKATGDLKLDTPLYELGITGIFTKTLDVAMLGKLLFKKYAYNFEYVSKLVYTLSSSFLPTFNISTIVCSLHPFHITNVVL